MCPRATPFNGHTLPMGWSSTSWSWTLMASMPWPNPVFEHILYFLLLSQSKHPGPVNLVQAKCSCRDQFHLFLYLCVEAHTETQSSCPPALGSTQCWDVCQYTNAMLSSTSGNLPRPKRSQERSVNEVTANRSVATRNVGSTARREDN